MLLENPCFLGFRKIGSKAVLLIFLCLLGSILELKNEPENTKSDFTLVFAVWGSPVLFLDHFWLHFGVLLVSFGVIFEVFLPFFCDVSESCFEVGFLW